MLSNLQTESLSFSRDRDSNWNAMGSSITLVVHNSLWKPLKFQNFNCYKSCLLCYVDRHLILIQTQNNDSYFFLSLFCCLTSQSTTMVMSRQSVNLTTRFLGRLRPRQLTSTRVRATGRNCRQMRRKNIFGTKKIYLAKTSGEKKFSSEKIGILISPIWAILCHLIAN